MATIIVIDAGHGGKDSGAIGITGRLEKDFNLQVVLKLKQLFLKNNAFEVQLTRETDVFVELNDRAKYANKLKAAAFISIHANKGTDATANGYQTEYTREASKKLAETIHSHVVPATGFRNRGVIVDNLAVCRETTMPAILLEAGFLSNPVEEAKLFTEGWQNTYAQAIYEGFCAYFNINPVVKPVDDQPYPKMEVTVNEKDTYTGYNISNITWVPSRPIGEELGAVIGYVKGKVTINGTPVDTKLFGNLGYVQVRDIQKYTSAKLFWDKEDPTKVLLYKS